MGEKRDEQRNWGRGDNKRVSERLAFFSCKEKLENTVTGTKKESVIVWLIRLLIVYKDTVVFFFTSGCHKPISQHSCY